jgi:hypothetical protein
VISAQKRDDARNEGEAQYIDRGPWWDFSWAVNRPAGEVDGSRAPARVRVSGDTVARRRGQALGAKHGMLALCRFVRSACSCMMEGQDGDRQRDGAGRPLIVDFECDEALFVRRNLHPLHGPVASPARTKIDTGRPLESSTLVHDSTVHFVPPPPRHSTAMITVCIAQYKNTNNEDHMVTMRAMQQYMLHHTCTAASHAYVCRQSHHQ